MRTGSRISVVIPTYNAERTLDACLSSVDWADEVLVVDMFSTDRTLEICAAYPNTRVIQRRDYIFGNVNHGMEMAAGEWIIRHDSDEMITPELRDEILSKRDDGTLEEYDGYYIAERINHFGTWLPNGEPGRSGREKLFRKGFASYEVKQEHEHPTIRGRWGHMQNVYLHDSNPTVAYMLKKFIYYAERDAARADLSQAKSGWYIAYRTMKTFVSTSLQFRRSRRSYGEGMAPVLSVIWAFKYFVEAALLWERVRNPGLGGMPQEGSLVRDFGNGARTSERPEEDRAVCRSEAAGGDGSRIYSAVADRHQA